MDRRAAALQRRMVQRKAERNAAKGASIPQSGGTPLSADVQAKMAPKLGADLSNVRVHTNGESAQAASDFGARAFTVGNDVHFNSAQFAPGSKEGDRLLAHELTHVVQGQKSGVQRKAEPDGEKGDVEVSQPEDASEKEADSVADGVTNQLHGEEKPIELPPEVRAELEKELGPLPPFEIFVAPDKVPPGEVAAGEGNRVYVRSVEDAKNPAALKGAIRGLETNHAGPGDAARTGTEVSRKVMLSPEAAPAAPEGVDLEKGDMGRDMNPYDKLYDDANNAMSRALSKYLKACSDVEVDLNKEVTGDADLFGQIFELIVSLALPIAGSLLGGAVKAFKVDHFLKEGVGEAVTDILGEEAKEGLHAIASAAGEHMKEKINTDKVTEYLRHLPDMQGSLMEEIADKMGKKGEKPGFAIAVKTLFTSEKCSEQSYYAEIMKLAREFQAISGIKRSDDGLAVEHDQTACWVGKNHENLAVVQNKSGADLAKEEQKIDTRKLGVDEDGEPIDREEENKLADLQKPYKFVSWITDSKLKEKAIANTIKVGNIEETKGLPVISSHQIEDLPKAFLIKEWEEEGMAQIRKNEQEKKKR